MPLTQKRRFWSDDEKMLICAQTRVCVFVFGGIEGVNAELERTIGRDAVAQFRRAIRKHYRRGSRGRKP